MKIKLVLSIITITLFCTVKSYSQANFSGVWAIDNSKSYFGKVPTYVMPTSIELQKKSDSLFVTFKVTGQDGNPYKVSSKYDLTGKVVEKAISNGGTMRSIMIWSADHLGLTKNQTYYLSAKDPAQPTKTINETWTLSADGKTLTIQQTAQIIAKPESNYTIKAIYEKQ